MKAAEFFARERSRDELVDAIRAAPGQFEEKAEWVLQIWESERQREELLRGKANQVLGFHAVAVTTILAAFPTVLAQLEGLAGHGIALGIFSSATIVTLTAAIMGIKCAFELLRPRMRQVLDPTMVLGEAQSSDDWYVQVIAEVLRSYRRNVSMLQELSFQARLLMEWLLVTLVAAASAYALPAIALKFPISGYATVGLVSGMAAGAIIGVFLWYRLVCNPKPHK